MIISWENRLKINIGLIDLEHRMMVVLIKKLDVAIKQQISKQLLIRTLRELKEYTRFHFVSEENLMLEIGFPNYAAHEKIHSQLLAQLDVVIARVNQGSADSEETLTFIWRWLEAHVLAHDREIGIYLQNHKMPTISQHSYTSIFPESGQ